MIRRYLEPTLHRAQRAAPGGLADRVWPIRPDDRRLEVAIGLPRRVTRGKRTSSGPRLFSRIGG